MKRCITAFLLLICFISVIPLSVSAYGVNPDGVYYPEDVLYNHDAVDAWDITVDNWIYEFDPTGALSSLDHSSFWDAMNDGIYASIPGRQRSYEDMTRAASKFNAAFRSSPVYALDVVLRNYLPTAIVAFDNNLGAYVLVDQLSGRHIVAQSGVYHYYIPEVENESGEVVGDPALGGSWKRSNVVNWEKVHVLSEYSLYDIGYALRRAGEDNEVQSFSDVNGPKYEYIESKRTESGFHFIYCDDKGYPYVCRPDSSQWAQDSNNNYYTDDDGDGIYDNGPTENNKLVDVDNNTIWFPDGSIQYFDNLYYDATTSTYYIDAGYYDIDYNTYVTNNYHYEYHINYTSITYIGQTEEYNKTYEFYYELPDGRNSADLTAEELQALNISIDVVPYIRSADNTAIRALYHFDANTRDSSFWSYAGGLTWTQGASLTYMDAGEFNGALYLDEGNHDFTIQLPSAIGTTDFTMQFRIYHSATLTPQTDSYIYIGDTKVAYFTGAAWGLGTSGTGSPASPGNWCEVALIRHNKVLYLYINGLCVASAADTKSYPDSLRFSFGSSQQTYKYFDELRVLNYALVEGGSSYEPTAVPHDTNLTLVLPDSTVPVADEYWSFNAEGNLFSVYDLTEYLANSKVAQKTSLQDVHDNSRSNSYWVYYNSGLSVGYANGAFGFTSSTAYTANFSNGSTNDFPNGFFYPLMYYDEDGYASVRNGLKRGGTYTFTAITRDGEQYSVTFTLPSDKYSTQYKSVEIPGGGYLAFVHCDTWYTPRCFASYIGIYPPSKGTVEFVYLELVEGEANTGHEFVSAVAPVDTDFKTPTLAVRTDLTITGYQLGGVRPSLPTKGLVWALIESGRISSLQIYNGQAWEQVDGRIWTGSRWVPYYAYDVLLLKDLYDIVESDPTLNPIYTEAGFWAWLQEAWGEMMKKLDQIIAALGGSSGSDDLTVQLPGGEDDPNTDEDDSWTVITLVTELKDGVWRVVTGVITVVYDGVVSVVDGIDAIDGFFSVYDPSSSNTIFAVAIEEG